MWLFEVLCSLNGKKYNYTKFNIQQATTIFRFGNAWVLYYFFWYDFDRRTKHPNFDPTGIRTHDLQTMKSTF